MTLSTIVMLYDVCCFLKVTPAPSCAGRDNSVHIKKTIIIGMVKNMPVYNGSDLQDLNFTEATKTFVCGHKLSGFDTVISYTSFSKILVATGLYLWYNCSDRPGLKDLWDFRS